VYWLYGGYGVSGWLSDLWKYDMNNNMWTWVGGNSFGGAWPTFGTIGVSAQTNLPGGKAGSHGYKDSDGNLWMYGGTGMGMYNVLWRYVPDPACGACAMPTALFSASNQICPGTCIDFINNSESATSYQWAFTGANPSTSTAINPANICYSSPGTYSVTLIAANSFTSDTLILNNYITVFPYPAPQGITQIADTLFANAGAQSYQWYLNGNIINGATDDQYVALQSGDYNVIATDTNGCEVEAVINNVIAKISSIIPDGLNVSISVVDFEKLKVEAWPIAGIKIFDIIGHELFSATLSDNKIEIDISVFSKGLYLLQLQSEQGNISKKFIKDW
jgi:hypothetical protein